MSIRRRHLNNVYTTPTSQLCLYDADDLLRCLVRLSSVRCCRPSHSIVSIPLRCSVLRVTTPCSAETSNIQRRQCGPPNHSYITDQITLSTIHTVKPPVTVAARSKPVDFGRSTSETVGSNSTGGMDVSLLLVLCVVRQSSLRQADHSSRWVLPTAVRSCV